MLYTVTNGGLQNGRPTQIGANTIEVGNRTSKVFSLANFTTETTPVYSDPEADALAYIKILSLPAVGVLKLGGVNVNANDIISSADITTNNFTYDAPNQDAGVVDVFQFDAADIGSNSLSGLDDGIITLNVASIVNQPPDVVGDNTILIGYGQTKVFTEADFTTGTTPAYNDPEGDPAFKLKVLDLPVSGDLVHNGVNVLVNQEILFSEIASGYLTYTPDPLILTIQTLEFNFAIADSVSGIFTT